MRYSPYRRPVSLLLLVLFSCGAARAQSDQMAENNRWRYDPSVGIAGMASVGDNHFNRLEVECGNGGSPSIALGPVPRPPSVADPDIITLRFLIDDRAFDERFRCYANEDACFSYDFQTFDLVRALRRGRHVRIILNGEPLFRFTLTGSHAAIGRLKSCLSP